MSIPENLQRVRAEIAAACARVGRSTDSVHLVAVSKTHPAAFVEQAALKGQVDFGENRIAELEEKRTALQALPLQWHLIGQLQTNKVKLLHGDTILHSLDRISLAEKLQSRFAGERIRCLIQVNCSGEASKSGVDPKEFDALIDAVAARPAIQVMGLMTMAENTHDEIAVRRSFAQLRQFSERLAAQHFFAGYAGWLSMGMSGDFPLAIAEGATHVRIGSAIFGGR